MEISDIISANGSHKLQDLPPRQAWGLYLISFLASERMTYLSSLCLYLSAISAYHTQVDGFSPFMHPLAKRFVKELLHLYPPVKKQPELWDLPMVL